PGHSPGPAAVTRGSPLRGHPHPQHPRSRVPVYVPLAKYRRCQLYHWVTGHEWARQVLHLTDRQGHDSPDP
ncbi:hypothetical protein, partial [Streptomyces chartreusis]|uniref:hypothetical protein n=1 Tax=Streptomyces chartreusis TaxID=1969 RepID=UPI00369B8DDF